MHSLRRLDGVAPQISFERLSSQQVEDYLKSLINKDKDKEVNPALIQEALRGIRMPMQVSNAEGRVLKFLYVVFQRLESVGYGIFKNKNSENTFKLIQSNLYPPVLKKTMAEHLEFQEGLKENAHAYVDILCKEGVIFDRLKTVGDRSTLDAGKTKQVNDRKRNDSLFPPKSKESMGNTKGLPFLNPKCEKEGVRHIGGVQNCSHTSKTRC